LPVKLFHYFISAIDHLYFESPDRVPPWEGQNSDRAEPAVWPQRSKHKIKGEYAEPGRYVEMSGRGGISDLGFAAQRWVVE